MFKQSAAPKPNKQSGNVIFFVLLGVALIGIVTVAVRSGGSGTNIDAESLTIKTAQVRQHAQELERAVTYIMQNGASEVELRFAHPEASSDYGDITNNPHRQVFGVSGGGAEYRAVPSGLNDGSPWEFYAHTHIPGVGSQRADLIAVIPNVIPEFCARINQINGQTGEPRTDSGGDCIHNQTLRFSSSNLYQDAAPNELDDSAASFAVTPAMQACVDCNPSGTPAYHFYHVLMAR